MNHSAYTQLFRTAAEKSIAIGHTADECHFVRMIRSGGPFPNLDLKEFIDKQRSKLHYPALVLESYDAGYSDNRGDSIRKKPEGGFIILRKNGNATPDEIDAILDETEAIGEVVLAWIREQYALAIKLFDLNQVTSERVDLPASGLYGTRFNFVLPESATAALYYNSANYNS